jgi:tRNA A-37 threonylcarbamoyl transferase component Bud32
MGIGSSRESLATEQAPSQDEDVCPTVGCFSLFCPPTKHKRNDLLGSPMSSPTPNRYRNRNQIYGGLEAEDSSLNGHDNGANGHANGHGNDTKTHIHPKHYQTRNKAYTKSNSGSSSTSSMIYEGGEGEQMLLKKYQMCEVLGVGSTSICHRCVDRNTGKPFACKIIDKEQIEKRFEGMMEQFRSEIEALKSLDHPNIIKLYNVYTTPKRIYIVMELMAGGELFDYVVKKGTLTEAEASAIVRMVTNAMVYMHEQNIIHRDLKPENLLLTHKANGIYDIEVKIIDFGLSKVSVNIKKKMNMSTNT